jgi:hypothetical protein
LSPNTTLNPVVSTVEYFEESFVALESVRIQSKYVCIPCFGTKVGECVLINLMTYDYIQTLIARNFKNSTRFSKPQAH